LFVIVVTLNKLLSKRLSGSTAYEQCMLKLHETLLQQRAIYKIAASIQ